MKKYLAGVIITVIVMSQSVVFGESITKTIDARFGDVKLVVNGSAVDKETLLYDGRTYLPLRDIAETLGMDIIWDETTKTVKLNTSNQKKEADDSDIEEMSKVIEGGFTKTIVVKFGEAKLVINDKQVPKDALLYDGRTYLPLRDTAEALGMELTWDINTRTAKLSDEEHKEKKIVKSDTDKATKNIETELETSSVAGNQQISDLSKPIEEYPPGNNIIIVRTREDIDEVFRKLHEFQETTRTTETTVTTVTTVTIENNRIIY